MKSRLTTTKRIRTIKMTRMIRKKRRRKTMMI